MVTATQNLKNDHVYILKLTDIMLAMTQKDEAKPEHVELVLDLIRNFADKFHHAKEEDLLFPLLGQKGFPVENGPVGVMLMEHDQGRNFVKGAAEAIEEYKDGKSSALQAVYENMTGFANLLQNHIYKEDNILFSMADEALSAEEQENLKAKFAEAEAKANVEFNAENSIRKITTLAEIYLNS